MTFHYSSYVGGIAGSNQASIQQCSSSINLSGNRYVGGIVGNCSSGMVENSYFTGGLSGENYCGGIVGVLYSNAKVDRCFAYADITVLGSSYFGEIAGASYGNVANCYYLDIPSIVSSYGQSSSASQMSLRGYYVNWDFTGIDGNSPVWTMPDGSLYPLLGWEVSGCVVPELAGERLVDAQLLIEGCGLVLGDVTYVPNREYDAGVL